MSNRQLGWDDQRIRDRISPREIAEANKEAANQQEGEGETQAGGGVPSNTEGWIPPGNPGQGSRKKKKGRKK